MKQKVVIRVQMGDAKKRAKAMKVVVGIKGVLSAAIEGADKNKIVIIGEGVDSVTLTTSLRKRMGFAELISVSVVEEEKELAESTPVMTRSSYGRGVLYPAQFYYVNEAYSGIHNEEPSCRIM
ncbi:hypothetical protein Taro_050655 [Colocasia esculenta]|uniref:Uncharacterized protein n=1 Tax=Colocasia esculenta TaxID=4460 RepID=A0A843XEM7_COLES|nr:hypothetical protein [Colocasia esculenta]